MERTAYSLLGQNGGILINDNSAHLATTEFHDRAFYCSIQALTSAVLDASEMGSPSSNTCSIEDLDTDLTIPAGTTIYGRFGNCQLTSGTVIAYVG